MTAALHPELGDRFRAEVKTSTRATGIVGGAVAIVAMPAWIGFDYVVEPEHAGTFALFRLLALVPIATCLGALFTGFGRRRPEVLVLAIVAAVQITIAFMIPRVETQYAAYALGISLAIYATAFLLVWPPRYTAAAIGITWSALGLALLTAPAPFNSTGVATVAFYLATASVIAYFGQAHCEGIQRRELDARAALEREQTRSVELLEELDRQSREDPLTALANRRAWDETLARECARAARGQGPPAILLCDVDRLKEVNDRMGHAAGDAVLKAVADVLRLRARDSDLVARIGGDEFGILFAGSSLDGAVAVAEDIRRVVGEEHRGDVVLARTTVSVGVAHWDGAGDSPARIVLRADQRLYRAKASRDVVCFEDV
ncbi:MAG: diguanylate cyclase [Thermoleophilaceae bacterium]